MITVHHLENSRSQRVLWLLEELGLPYEVRRYQRDKATLQAPPELAKVHPLGKSPVITDGAATVAESGAIVEYLIDTYGAGRLRPEVGTPERLRYTYWLHFAEGSAMPPLLMKLVFDKVRSAPVPFFIKPIVKGIADKVTTSFIAPNIKRQLDFMEGALAWQPWCEPSSDLICYVVQPPLSSSPYERLRVEDERITKAGDARWGSTSFSFNGG